MEILDIPQGSPEWFAVKAGVPGASSFNKIITSKGEPSKQAKGYKYELAAEAITGKSEGYSNNFMQAMLEREEESRPYYELITGYEVKQVGFIFDDQKMCGCSPDGLVYISNKLNHGLEMKNVLPKTQVEYLLSQRVPSDYIPQVQGSMFVTRLERWDFLTYCPGLQHFLIQCEPDLKFHSRLKELLEKFCFELALTIKKLKEA